MAKWLLRVSVVLMLLLSAAALAMGYMLFEQRGILKGRTQNLETAVKQIASTIETGDGSGAMMRISDEQLAAVDHMVAPLNQLATAAKYQLEMLNLTRQDLATTREALAKTEDELKVTKIQLDDVNKKYEIALATIVEKDSTINEKEVVIQSLEREKVELGGKIADLEFRTHALQVANRDLTDKLAEQSVRVETLEAQADPSKKIDNLAKGRQGVILYVDPNWNFVIFDISQESLETVVPDLELIVHRGERFVGKVRVSNVEANLAVAEIMNDWQQAPVERNDEVIY